MKLPGMTLIELMVATVISMLFIGAVFGIYQSATRAMTLSRDQQEVYQTGRILLGQLSAELTSAYQRRRATTSSLTGTSATDAGTGMPEDTVTFLTTAHIAPSGQAAGDISQLTYQIGAGTLDATTGLYVVEDFTPGIEASTDTPAPRLLSPLVVGLHCRYLSEDGTWQSDWSGQTTLPAAARIELTLQPRTAGGKPVTLATTANFMLATAPATGGG